MILRSPSTGHGAVAPKARSRRNDGTPPAARQAQRSMVRRPITWLAETLSACIVSEPPVGPPPLQYYSRSIFRLVERPDKRCTYGPGFAWSDLHGGKSMRRGPDRARQEPCQTNRKRMRAAHRAHKGCFDPTRHRATACHRPRSADPTAAIRPPGSWRRSCRRSAQQPQNCNRNAN
jgi:hypothetical protein